MFNELRRYPLTLSPLWRVSGMNSQGKNNSVPEAHDNAVANLLSGATSGFRVLPSYTPDPHLVEEIDERGAVTQVDIVLRSITHNGHPCSPDEDEGKRQYQTDFVGNIFL